MLGVLTKHTKKTMFEQAHKTLSTRGSVVLEQNRAATSCVRASVWNTAGKEGPTSGLGCKNEQAPCFFSIKRVQKRHSPARQKVQTRVFVCADNYACTVDVPHYVFYRYLYRMYMCTSAEQV